MGGTCRTYGLGGGVGHTGFWWGYQREIGHFIDLGVDKRVILKWPFTKWNGGNGLNWPCSG